MDIKIVRRPLGEAPDWVRDEWIGVSLPLASQREREWRGLGVLSAPDGWLAQMWAVVSGKSVKVRGYAVNAKTAVERLADRSPSAAAWWRDHTPRMLDGRHNFLFDAAACQRET
ncbi:hypothetical protein [Sphingomonas sp. Leaf343]|uniref:hypothetical protein n=1 Tax=Sphingomonas sp. Leaf343 TaxID=1736345 RepID=UPI0006FB0691|nr:hypothetical protein [Sphingomonas sp. Leaf343]KQR83438.1 hypothetical protein ASG07_06820 [Sphingomonas sp. Leaf343]